MKNTISNEERIMNFVNESIERGYNVDRNGFVNVETGLYKTFKEQSVDALKRKGIIKANKFEWGYKIKPNV